MAKRDTVIRSSAPNGSVPAARYLSFTPEHTGKLVTLPNAQRFTLRQARAHIDAMEKCGEYKRGQFRAIAIADAAFLDP